MVKFVISCFVLLLAAMGARGQEEASADELKLAARAATVIDGLTGVTLYEKKPHEREYPASTTKILTALLVIEAGDLDRDVVVEFTDTQAEPSALYIKVGERYSRRQLLYGLMLKSANDVARALARDNAGSVEAFALKMTKRARELGATGSNFTNPNGLPDPQHYTTAADLAMISRAAMAQPFFHRIAGTLVHPWVSPDKPPMDIFNHNRLLRAFPGTTGIKTGYTRAAQQCLASAALRDHREVIAVVLHTNRPGIWEDSKALLNYGLEHPPEWNDESIDE